jgi:hypothetical protein
MAKIKGGYILQPRKLDESVISSFPPHVREIWLYLLRKAYYRNRVISGRAFNRGQLLTSYREIISDLSWKVGYRTESYKKHHCETAMKLLMKEHMVATTKTTRGFIVTILKYDYYQCPENYETDNVTDNEPTMNRQSTDTILKEYKNIKKEKNKDILLSQVDKSTLNHKEIEYYQVAISFWELVKTNLTELNISGSSIERAKYKTWVNPIRLLMENDGRTIEEFREIFRFLQKDDFWKEQIRSTAKLRKKNREDITYFEVLLTKSRHDKKRKQQKESSDRSGQSGVSEDYRKSILNRLLNPQNTETT